MSNFKIIDITMPIHPGLTPQWPGSPEIRLDFHKCIQNGDSVNDRNLFMNLHTGTHIEAAEHFIDQGATIDQFSIKPFWGDCFVADFSDQTEVNEFILQTIQIPSNIKRILFKTKNSEQQSNTFNPNFIALTKGGAEWLVRNEFILVGNDYLSIQAYKGNPDVHRVLMKNNIVILEGVVLSGIPQGVYELVCLPLKLLHVEASPVRALLKKKEI